MSPAHRARPFVRMMGIGIGTQCYADILHTHSTMESETVAARNVIGLLGAKLGYGKGWKDACTTDDDDWIWIDC